MPLGYLHGALRFAMERVQGDDALYGNLIALAEATFKDQGPREFVDADIEFHKGLVATSGVEPLLAFTDILHAFFRRFHEHIVENRQQPEIGHHREVVEMLRKGDYKGAENVLNEHLSHFLNTEELNHG